MGALATQKYSCVARIGAKLLKVGRLNKDAIFWLVLGHTYTGLHQFLKRLPIVTLHRQPKPSRH